MPKIDPRKTLAAFYRPLRKLHFVDVPPLRYAMIDGQGAPGSPDFQRAIEALFTISYRAKFLLKKQGTDYAVMPLEGLWWADDMASFAQGHREKWRWTLIIHQPDFVPAEVLAHAKVSTQEQGKAAAAAVRFEKLCEGRCAQILHLGPFADEAPAIARLHAAIAEQGGALSGHHHEIYLSDFRRTAPEKLRTILRQPFRAQD